LNVQAQTFPDKPVRLVISQAPADSADNLARYLGARLSGDFVNHTTGVSRQFAPLPDGLRDMVALGGTTGVLRKWWEERKAAEAALAV
jgi:hypothetical protein